MGITLSIPVVEFSVDIVVFKVEFGMEWLPFFGSFDEFS